MMRRRQTLVAVSFALLAALSACSDSNDSKPASGDSTVAKPDNSDAKLPDASIRAYFDALASNDVAEMEKAQAVTAPDSVAFAYAQEQVDIQNASIDGGNEYPAEESKKVGKTYQSCSDDENGKEVCAIYSDFESEDGKLANFKINGKDISESIAVGNGGKKDAGDLATVEYLSSYKSPVSGNVFVNARVTSKKESINIDVYTATYRGTDKRQSTAISGDGPTELAADSTATISMIFKAAELGGVVTLSISDSDYNAQTVSLNTR